jgi:hypothetical protein
VAHCTASKDNRLPMFQPGPKDGPAGQGELRGSYRVLEQIASSENDLSTGFYNCPVCRKPQVMQGKGAAAGERESGGILRREGGVEVGPGGKEGLLGSRLRAGCAPLSPVNPCTLSPCPLPLPPSPPHSPPSLR